MKIKTLSVSEVSNYLKKIIDNDFILMNLSVKGEISNLKYHSSGHIYFSLKDEGSKINAIMFRDDKSSLNFKLEEGMSIIVKGRISIYPASGSLQLYVKSVEQEGEGNLFIKFEKLKERLNKEGYFNEEHKKPIPVFPKRIGIITSETGAAVRDIINVSRRRNSLVDLILYPAQVQGKDAYKTLIDGIRYFDENKSVDVIILGRGGGSIEELWNFNEEDLAKEIFKCKIPIISAVGHETDFTISDFVSDLRAATPSQAAEIAVPLEEDLYLNIKGAEEFLNKEIKGLLLKEREKVKSLEKMINLQSPKEKIVNSYIEIDNLKKRLNSKILSKIYIEKEKLTGINNLLMANNPISLLNKGYAIIEDEKEIIKSIEQLKNDKDIEITLKDGKVNGHFIINKE
ncbi:MAG: exodeoxyribonuclease VII large subunit [Clostridium sp.]|nr:exodeoxyribonuclease VII large subunit [Clostridium sp.]